MKKRICPYCNTENGLEAQSCTKCGGPMTGGEITFIAAPEPETPPFSVDAYLTCSDVGDAFERKRRYTLYAWGIAQSHEIDLHEIQILRPRLYGWEIAREIIRRLAIAFNIDPDVFQQAFGPEGRGPAKISINRSLNDILR